MLVACRSPAQLYNDFVKYETARLSQDEFAQDGSTPLKRACRDGDADVLGSLLLELDSSSQQPIRASNPRASAQKPEPAETSFSLTDANLLDDALCIACKYVRLACVRLLLSYHAPTRHVTGPGLSTALLHATLGRAPGRDAVDLDASRSGIVQVQCARCICFLFFVNSNRTLCTSTVSPICWLHASVRACDHAFSRLFLLPHSVLACARI